MIEEKLISKFKWQIIHCILILLFSLFFTTCPLPKSRFRVTGDYCTEKPIKWGRYNYDTPAISPDKEFVVFSYGGNPYGTDSAGMYLYRMNSGEFTPLFAGLPPILVLSKHFSPDGKWIAFPHASQIWKIKVNGDSLTQLTFTRLNFHPRWSPDGTKIMFHVSAGDSAGIWIINSDGTNRRRFGEWGWECADWSPSGEQFIFVLWKGDFPCIAIIDTTGENFKILLEGSKLNFIKILYPHFSPDGSQIIFSAQRPGEGMMIWRIDNDGSNPVPLAAGDEPDWFPDGSKIIYTNTIYGEVWIMDDNGCNKTPLIGDFNFKGDEK